MSDLRSESVETWSEGTCDWTLESSSRWPTLTSVSAFPLHRAQSQTLCTVSGTSLEEVFMRALPRRGSCSPRSRPKLRSR